MVELQIEFIQLGAVRSNTQQEVKWAWENMIDEMAEAVGKDPTRISHDAHLQTWDQTLFRQETGMHRTSDNDLKSRTAA